ncbi:methyltransferase, FxLD system [Fodinicola acaciae]|uniref:methyltransferase, FxLD system n=1 Tax=Fodinicola acaciae TaxID=2681555 RepID=UPI0013D26A25|nr:methyltransferase, FxLD system [Fodinicola acaciae]
MNNTVASSPEQLRTRMVDKIMRGAWPPSARVAEAMRTVPRHEFVPHASAEDAYDDRSVITKTAPDGTALSCASTPIIVAMMLDQLDIRPGQRVLEIGAGTGYNAALLANLTGPSGHVTTVDIDPEITAGARKALDATGYGHVHVAARDGALGDKEHAPYDRIIVTVGAWDLPAAWWSQLSQGGRLVLPLRWRGQTQSVAFTHRGDNMISESMGLCGFVPMIGQEGERTGYIDDSGHVSLYWDADQPIEPARLQGVLGYRKTEAWSGVTVGPLDPFDGIWLRLTATESGTCRIAADQTAIDRGLCTPAVGVRSPAIVRDKSIAYFALHRPARHADPGNPRFELGAIGHGPAGPELADRLCAQIRAWDNDRTAQPTLTAYPDKTTPSGGSYSIQKQESRLTITM